MHSTSIVASYATRMCTSIVLIPSLTSMTDEKKSVHSAGSLAVDLNPLAPE
jgi:hypothetical protein